MSPYRSLSSTYDALRCPVCRVICIDSKNQAQTEQDVAIDDYMYRAQHADRWDLFAEDFFHWALKHHPRLGSVLDIGCSVGHFVRYGRLLGLDIEGIDIDKNAILHGLREGLPLRHGRVEEVTQTYDTVIMNHVFEHLDAPLPFLSHIHRILRTRGSIILAMPYPYSLQSILLRDRWIGWGPGQHRWLYSRQSIRLLLTRGSFDVEALAVRNGAIFRPSLKSCLDQSVYSTVREVCVRGSVYFADAIRRGAQVFVCARKSDNE